MPGKNWNAETATREDAMSRRFVASLGLLLVMAMIPAASAQETTGVPGAPGATTTIDGRYLPPPPQQFRGEIDTNAAQSKPYWPELVVPPKGAPNILLIMTDDVGFSAPSTFGGVIPTPALDRVAQMGLRYTAFQNHRTVLADAGRPADWPQPSLGVHGRCR
jgi:hypothetical protein